jgi:acyl-coenzyme A thioesterase PaaI-like protein
MWHRVPAFWLKLAFNLWPPFIGAGIRVRRISGDFREIVVEMPLRLYNRSMHGAHAGGSLYAMTDPFFACMVLRNLPRGYRVWDKAAAIDFIAPGRGRVRVTLRLAQPEVEKILRITEQGDRHLHLFQADVVDAEGLVVARVEKMVYIRKHREAT